MKINNTDISAFSAKQFTFETGHNSLTNASEWAAGSAVPYFARNDIGFASYTLTLVVKGQNRQEIMRNCSDILALLTGPVDLTVDGFSHKYKVVLDGFSHTERAQRTYHLLTLEFHGYEYGATVTEEGETSITIVNPGNLVSPAIVTVTPQADITSVTLSGICRNSRTGEGIDVVIPDLEEGKPVILDGVSGLTTQDGDPKNVTMWTLPTLLPGSNIVTCNNAFVTVTVECIPLYI